jgi:hypothetical protein
MLISGIDTAAGLRPAVQASYRQALTARAQAWAIRQMPRQFSSKISQVLMEPAIYRGHIRAAKITGPYRMTVQQKQKDKTK